MLADPFRTGERNAIYAMRRWFRWGIAVLVDFVDRQEATPSVQSFVLGDLEGLSYSNPLVRGVLSG
jgi:hypothetical protein